MPDTAMRAAYTRLPQVERELEASKALIDELKIELRVALRYTNNQYALDGHYVRVMVKFLVD